MAGLIKKQILKHLSKFAKNLSSDSIQLSTLRGEGELSNLELDCSAIQNLINLPTWLQINQAKCNKVHVKIPWTKLKGTGITIFLDAVELDMVTCEKPRPPNGPSPIEASASSGDASYGFIQKVLEGISLRINSINVNFSSAVFKAEFQLSQLLVYSTNPDGKQADLRFTRILNKELGQVLTFKKVTWQTMRIAVDSAASISPSGIGCVTTPIRLITNQAQIKIILRRKVSDLSVIASQLQMQFDDLLWVLTDAQVQSALLCVKSIRETIERSQLQSKQNTANSAIANLAASPTSIQLPESVPASPTSDQYFNAHNIQETSFHIDIDRIDLHVCDDGSNNNKEATYKKVVEGGAILVTLHSLKLDHYPYHKAGKSRKHFRGYNEILSSRDKWADENINQFRKDFLELKKAAVAAGHIASPQNSKLLESCFVARLGDLDVGQVSSSSDKERSSNKIFSSQRKELLLPEDMPLACAVFTDYFFPDGRNYPAPHNNIFMRVNAPRIWCHWPSFLWCNQLALSTLKSVQKMLDDLGVVMATGDPKEEDHVDIRIETLMPKIFVPSPIDNDDPNSPEGLEIQISQAAVTNCRRGENSSRKSLLLLLQTVEKLFIAKNPSTFPQESGHDLDFLHRCLRTHAEGKDIPVKIACSAPSPQLIGSALKQKAYQDVWSVWLRQVWIDFVMKPQTTDASNPNLSPGSSQRTCPFIDSLPIFMWFAKPDIDIPKPLKTSSDSGGQVLRPKQSESTPIPKEEKQFEVEESALAGLEHVIAYDQDRKVKFKASKAAKSNSVYQSNSLPSLDTDGFMAEQLPVASLSSCELSQQTKSDDSVHSLGEEAARKSRPKNKMLLDFYRGTIEESPVEAPLPKLPTFEGPASTYILVDTDSHLRLMLDHYQFLFLLRLAESMESIGEKVYNDTDAIFSDKSSSCGTLNVTPSEPEDTQSSGVRVVLPEASLYLVLEPSPEVISDPVKEPSDISSVTSSNCSPSHDPLLPSPPVTSPQHLTPAPSECSSSDTVSILGDDIPLFNSPAVKSRHEETSQSLATAAAAPTERASLPASPTFGRKRGNTDPIQTLRRKADDRLQTKIKVLNGSITSSVSFENVSSRSTTVVSSGYDTASFDSSMNSIVSSHEEDCTSIASSGDSDNQFVLLDVPPPFAKPMSANNSNLNLHDLPDVGQMEVPHPSMVDSQVTMVDGQEDADSLEEEPGSTVDRSVQTAQKEEITKPGSRKVSVLRISAQNKVELSVDARGDDAAVKLVVNKVALHDLGNMTLDGAGALFSTQAKVHHTSNSFPSVRMRIDSGPSASRFSKASVKTGMLQLHVDHLRETVNASSLANIGAFLEDEVVPEVMPMKIEANDVHLTIRDDGESVYSSTAKLPPIALHVHQASVKRVDDGTFHVSMDSTGKSVAEIAEALKTSPTVTYSEAASTPEYVDKIISPIATVTLSQSPDQAKSAKVSERLANGELPAKPAESPKIVGGGAQLQIQGELDQLKMEKDIEVMCLNQQLADLGKERDSLVAALQMMQDDLMASEQDRKSLRDRLKLVSAQR